MQCLFLSPNLYKKNHSNTFSVYILPIKWIYLAQQEDKENSMEDDSDDNIEGGHSFLILSRSDSSMVLISSYILYLMLI